MPKRVFKYKLSKRATTKIELPVGAQPLHVNIQDGEVYLWALLDEKLLTSKFITILVLGTGHEINHPNHRYINTFLVNGGENAFHAFEVFD